jgi:hypothetical protein
MMMFKGSGRASIRKSAKRPASEAMGFGMVRLVRREEKVTSSQELLEEVLMDNISRWSMLVFFMLVTGFLMNGSVDGRNEKIRMRLRG